MNDVEKLQDALHKAQCGLLHAKLWITLTCANAMREGTSVDTLASGKADALEPINRALRRLTPFINPRKESTHD